MNLERVPVICRPARQEDTPAVIELTKTIWDGNDYVPHVWHKWLEDPQGQLVVAEGQGQVLGLGKLTRVADQDWWLEGLRVDPQYEGRGVASQLHHHLLGVWEQIGSGALRLATASFRLPVQHLCAITGFTFTGEYTNYAADLLAEPVQTLRQLSPAEAPAALETILMSESMGLQNGLTDLGWKWCPPNAEMLARAAVKGWLWGGPAQQDQELDRFLLLTLNPEEGISSISLLACKLDEIPELLLDFRRLAAAPELAAPVVDQSAPKAGWISPLHPLLLPLLEQAGFERTWDASAYLYTKKRN